MQARDVFCSISKQNKLCKNSKWKIIFFFFLYSDATKREKLCQLSPECDTVALELEVTVTCKQKAISKQAQAKQYIFLVLGMY